MNLRFRWEIPNDVDCDIIPVLVEDNLLGRLKQNPRPERLFSKACPAQRIGYGETEKRRKDTRIYVLDVGQPSG